MISWIFNTFWEPFFQYPFMQKALLGCIALALGCGPMGTFLVLRRMSLIGDALSHGILPGVAIAFLISGFSIVSMSLGGVIAGLIFAYLAHVITQRTVLSTDNVFAALFIFSMALGIFILSVAGGYMDVMHILIGNVLVLSKANLLWIGSIASLTLLGLACFYRPLIIYAFDPPFFRTSYGKAQTVEILFLTFLTLNLVSAFQALGTLMALGVLLLPAITARLMTKQIWILIITATGLAIVGSYLGLLISYHASWPSGPVIILVLGSFYGMGLLYRLFPRHVTLLGWSVLWLLILTPLLLPQVKKPVAPIMASFTVLADMTRNIVPSQLRVDSLVGPDRDPHVYEPSPGDLIRLLKADVVVINGLRLEAHWLDRLIKSGTLQGKVINASAGCLPRFFQSGNNRVPDPHAWHDVKNAQRYVTNIARALSQFWSGEASLIQSRAQRYQKKLIRLERWIQNQRHQLKIQQPRVITTHDGFGYFGAAYRIKFLTPLGPSTSAEPSAKDIARIIHVAQKQHIRSIFLENMISPALMSMIARELGVSLSGTLYSDALSAPGGPAPTYIRMMRHNARTLFTSLSNV
jgi:zinc/manganese transport system permease protein